MDLSRCDSFSIHPLVHTWARERLDATARRRKEAEAVVVLGCFFKSRSNKPLEDWIFERRIYLHVMCAYDSAKRCMDSTGVLDERFYQATMYVHSGAPDGPWELHRCFSVIDNNSWK